jgi:hypothetical protein
LVSNDPVIHESAHNTQYAIVKEELWCKDWRLERHGQKVAMRPTVRCVAAVQIRVQTRPERLPAGFHQPGREVVPKDAKALLSYLTDLLVN